MFMSMGSGIFPLDELQNPTQLFSENDVSNPSAPYDNWIINKKKKNEVE